MWGSALGELSKSMQKSRPQKKKQVQKPKTDLYDGRDSRLAELDAHIALLPRKKNKIC
jgi:hypothetical protein